MTNSDTARRRQFIDGLHALASFYDENPGAWYDGIPVTLSMYVWGRQAREVLARTASAMGGCTTNYDDTNMTISKKFTGQVTLSVFAPRAKVGCRVRPAATEQVVAWPCDPLLTEHSKP